MHGRNAIVHSVFAVVSLLFAEVYCNDAIVHNYRVNDISVGSRINLAAKLI